MFPVLSISILLLMLAIHYFAARFIDADFFSYLFPWHNDIYISPRKRLAISLCGPISFLIFSFILLFIDYCLNGTEGNIVQAIFTVSETISQKTESLFLRFLNIDCSHHMGFLGCYSVLRTAANICLVCLVYMLLPLFPLNGGQIIIALVEWTTGKGLGKHFLLIISMFSALIICIRQMI